MYTCLQPKGGRLKLLARGETVPAFDDIAFTGELGVVHGKPRMTTPASLFVVVVVVVFITLKRSSYPTCCCLHHIKTFFLPNDISSTPSVRLHPRKTCSLLPNLDALTAPQSDEMV